MITPDEILARIDGLPMPEESTRNYIGASEIGTACTRYLWLRFHRYFHSKPFEPRMLRLFQRGKDEEFKFQTTLNAIGFEIIENCEEQTGFHVGFFRGHGDGVLGIDGIRVAAEYKTHNKKSFETLQPGMLHSTHPKHFAQSIVYADRFDCAYTLYCAVCKDDDRLFFDLIPANRDEYLKYAAKADYIAAADHPPERIASKPTAFDCKFCDAHSVCWGFQMPRAHCNNCTSSNKDQIAGVFGCELEKPIIGRLPIEKYCDRHSFNPHAMNDLIGWQPLEYYPETRSIQYMKPNGEKIINGDQEGGVLSKNLVL